MKWPYASPNHRRGIAEALTDVTEVLLDPGGNPPPVDDVRRALREWTFSGLIRNGKKLPPDLAPTVHWLEQNTIPLADLSGDEGAAMARRMLDRISRSRTAPSPRRTPPTASGWCSAMRWTTPTRSAP
jgi:hypothetical protein